MPLNPLDPKAWLNLAQSDLAYAENPPTRGLFETSAYLAQQAAEKALKALLIHLQRPFPKTHNLDFLFELLEEASVTIPAEVRRAVLLQNYTIRGQYPSNYPELTKVEYQEALELAQRVVAWVEAQMAC
ncbi:HEPN domain-containing protein [Meiothermus sp.]|uniref:HEPN domain-containing protein n=1 Tax=Meiothermus sp. TaxID=1955249 RepID=UPI00307FC32D